MSSVQTLVKKRIDPSVDFRAAESVAAFGDWNQYRRNLGSCKRPMKLKTPGRAGIGIAGINVRQVLDELDLIGAATRWLSALRMGGRDLAQQNRRDHAGSDHCTTSNLSSR